MLQQIQLHRNFHKRPVIMIRQIQIQYFTDLGVSIFDGIIVNIESCSGLFQIPAILQDFLQGGQKLSVIFPVVILQRLNILYTQFL